MSQEESSLLTAVGRPSPVLALQGSPRRGGNTDRLLSEVLTAAAARGLTAEKVVIRDLKISPCLEIYQCIKDGRCGIEDDMTQLYAKLSAARIVVAATPIFFYGPSAQLKTVIDRCQALWARKYVLKEPPPVERGRGYLIAAGATRGQKLFDGLLLTIKYFFDVLNLDLAGQLLVRGVDAAGEVEGRPEALAEARAMGASMAEFWGESKR